ncbi:hypothetical protein C8Q75DRAFT_123965 [Abortiporus biennis]|nr:hypothetical protein C8Q75DRAFT_123965 [Abortiporus biennis]
MVTVLIPTVFEEVWYGSLCTKNTNTHTHVRLKGLSLVGLAFLQCNADSPLLPFHEDTMWCSQCCHCWKSRKSSTSIPKYSPVYIIHCIQSEVFQICKPFTSVGIIPSTPYYALVCTTMSFNVIRISSSITESLSHFGQQALIRNGQQESYDFERLRGVGFTVFLTRYSIRRPVLYCAPLYSFSWYTASFRSDADKSYVYLQKIIIGLGTLN